MCSGGEYEEAIDHMSTDSVAGNASGDVGDADEVGDLDFDSA